MKKASRAAIWALIACLLVSLLAPAALAADSVLSEEDVRILVMERVPGSTVADFTEFRLIILHATPIYQGEIAHGDMEAEFEVSPITGEFLKWEEKTRASFAPEQFPTRDVIGEALAKEIALSRVPGANAGDIREFKVSEDDGTWTYEGEIYYGNATHEFEIDARTGQILEWDTTVAPTGGEEAGILRIVFGALDRIPGATAANLVRLYRTLDNGQLLQAGEIVYGGFRYEFAVDVSTGTFVEWDVEVEGPVWVGPEGGMTEAQARELVLSMVPGATDANILRFRRAYEDGRWQYEGTLLHGGMEYEFEIDEGTGIVTDWDAESAPTQPDDVIGIDRAKEIAASQVDGASASDVLWCALDAEEDPEYEGELLYGGTLYKFEIDARTGAVREWRTEASDVGPDPGQTQDIGADRAKEIAVSRVPGATTANITKFKMDYEDGRLVYEGEIYLNGVEYEFEISAADGAILDWEQNGEPMPSLPPTSSLIGEQAAKDIVLSRVPGATGADFREFKTDRDDGRWVYEGELVHDGTEYDFEIDAATGDVLKWETKSVAPRPTPQPTTVPTSGLIGVQAARDIVLSRVPGASMSSFTQFKTDWDDGRWVYEGELVHNGVEYDFEMDAATGQVIKWEEDHVTRPQPTATRPGLIGEQAARDIVLSRVPGATASSFTEFKTDRDDGRWVYEGELVYNGTEYDFEIDAITGDVLKWETERRPGPAPSASSTRPPAATTTPRPQPPSAGDIGADRAKELALSRVPGAAASNIRDFDVDYDDGRKVYEGEIRYGGREYEFEIDAATGSFLKWEIDD